jgi:hypothetical protein
MIPDLRALLIGILGGIIAYYATKGIDRYLAGRTVRSRRRQIKQLTQELQLLERLGVTDRSLLLFAFRMLFPLIGLAALGVASWAGLSLRNRPMDDTIQMIFIISIFIGFVAFYASSVFRKLEDPEPKLEKLRQKLRELQGMDDQSPTG